MTITQATQNAAINWQSFNIGSNQSVTFVQPNASAVALNRVLGPDPSNIWGTLDANGKVFLINPNGILFGKGASINVGGLVASTLGLSDRDFLAGNYRFSGASAAAVQNQGSITADGGYVALLGANVSNQGVIAARLGTVALAGGNAVTLDVAGDGLLSVAVDQGAVHALVQNGGLIQADGGTVLLTTQAAGNLLSTAVNDSGIIEAQTVESHNGTIRLLGDMQSGTVTVSGLLDASAPNGGNGGNIETSAAMLDISPTVAITTAAPSGTAGTWLLDPYNVTISTAADSNTSAFTATASGANINTTTLQNALATTSVTVTTGSSGTENGDITVSAPISWSANTNLTLAAAGSIYLNAGIANSGGGSIEAKAAGNIIQAGVGITTQGGNVVYWANDAGNGGYVELQSGSSITTNGGGLWIGGGSGTAQWTPYAGASAITVGNGYAVGNATLTASGSTNFESGVIVAGPNSGAPTVSLDTISSGSTDGSISINGATPATAISGDNVQGVTIYGANVSSGRGTLTINGQGSTTAGSPGPVQAIEFGNSTLSSTSGAISLTGDASGGSGSNQFLGIHWDPSGTVASTTGAVNITGYSDINGQPWSSQDVGLAMQGTLGGAGEHGNITLQTDVFLFDSGTDLVQSTGGLTILPKAGEGLVVSASTPSTNSAPETLMPIWFNTSGTYFVPGFSGITLGSSGSTGAVTVSSPLSVADPLTINGSTVTVGANLTNTALNSAILVQATGDITQTASAAVTTNGGSVTYDSNSANLGSGNIWLQGTGTSGASINTNGGNITLSGGSNVATGYATGDAALNGNGVSLDTVNLFSGGGNIVIRGKSSTTNPSFSTSECSPCNTNDGIHMYGSDVINAGSGTIDLEGVAVGNSSSQYSNGIETSITGYTRILSSATNATAINLVGDASASTSSSDEWGVFLWGGNNFGIVVAATGTGGGVSISGKGGNFTGKAGGTHTEPNAYVLAASGPISLTGTAGALSTTYGDVDLNSTVGFVSTLPSGFGIASPVTSSSSNISITADSFKTDVVFGSGTFTSSAVQSSGTLSIAPRSPGKALAVQTTPPSGTPLWINPTTMFGSSGLFKTGFSSFVFGSASTGTVTLDNYTFDNVTTVDTGANAILGTISIPNHALTVNITGSGSVTDTGVIDVSSLALDAASSAVTLDNTGNAIGTLAADVASLSLDNATGLTVGSVAALNGVSATGGIDIETATGSLTVTQNIATSDTGSAAIVLDAGNATAAGIATGGDIVLGGTPSPSISVGSGGKAVLYTGSVSGSTGIGALVGSGNSRYDSSKTTPGFTVALGSSGMFAVYREQPILGYTAGSATITYGGSVPMSSLTPTYTSGLVNGDALAQVVSSVPSASYTSSLSSGGYQNAGIYAVSASGGVTGFGYGFQYTGGTLTVNAKALTITASAQSTTYGTALALGTSQFTPSGLVNGDSVAGVTLTQGGNATVPVTQAAGTYTGSTNGILASGATGTGLSNYTISYVPGTLTIDPKALTVSGEAALNKVYDGSTTATLTGGTLPGLINGDSVTLTQAGTFASKNVGTNITVTASDSISGPSAGNYTLMQPTGLTANITQLASVTWIGGASGNWFDPANWAGGAVPDLSNVANVVIPQGVTVTFDSANLVAPAQGGPVNLASVGSAGNLTMAAGTLNVSSGVRLNTLAQTGGTVDSNGPVAVDVLTQSGGTLGGAGSVTASSLMQSGGSIVVGGNVTAGTLTQTAGSIDNGGNVGAVALAQSGGQIANRGGLDVTQSFSQSAPGSIAVGGSIAITQAAGNLSFVSLAGNDIDLGANSGAVNLGALDAAGSLTVNASGNISQQPGSVIRVATNVAMNSTAGAVTVSTAGNSFGSGLDSASPAQAAQSSVAADVESGIEFTPEAGNLVEPALHTEPGQGMGTAGGSSEPAVAQESGGAAVQPLAGIRLTVLDGGVRLPELR
ncbi:filamentous haemagglutinin family outer membrane protein [Burkholderiales bacterium GJ-E10]|nr:filamentous haemagglutinin family outer membrane protein [Burkholderiales bacterium GJ-E10]